MKRLLLTLLLLGATAWGQGLRHNGTVANRDGRPVGGASIRICGRGASGITPGDGIPCSPLATVYTDEALTTAASNPLTADSQGNFGFWAPGIVLNLEISGAGLSTYNETVSLAAEHKIRFADQFTTIQAAITDAGTTGSVIIPGSYAGSDTYTNPNSIDILDLRATATTSAVKQDSLYFQRIDNSPPVGGAGILNDSYAPMARFDLLTQSGTTTGSHAVLLLNMPAVKGKSTTTLGQAITASASPQSVLVADSSIFPASTLPHGANIGPGLGSAVTEKVIVTAVADATHITAIFSNNHANGELVNNNFMGVKNALGISISDQAGNTDDVVGENPNCTAVSSVPGHVVNCEELDITNSTGVDAAKYGFDMATGGPALYGRTLLILGAGGKKVTSGLSIVSGDGLSQAWNGYLCEGCGVNGLVFTTGGGDVLRPDAAIRIQAATTAGLVIGANQTKATNPNYNTFDPTDGIFLTARTQAEGTANAASNKLTFQSIVGSVTHTMGLMHQEQAGGLVFLRDGATLNSFIGTDGSYNTRQFFNARDATGVVFASFGTTGAGAIALQQVNGGALTVTATTLNATTGFKVNGLGAANTFLKGNGTNYVSGSPVLASADFVNQGATTQVLHGNAAGNPSWAVVAPADAAGNTSGSGNFCLVTSCALVTPTIGGETISASPRGYMNADFTGNIPGVSTIGLLAPNTGKAITVTRVNGFVATTGAGCTTAPVVSVWDNTGSAIIQSVTIANGVQFNDSGAVSVNVAAGKLIAVRVTTAGVGCTTSPAGLQLAVEYIMQ